MHEVGGGVEVVPHGFGIFGQQVLGIVGERDGGWRGGGRGVDIAVGDQPVTGYLVADPNLRINGTSSVSGQETSMLSVSVVMVASSLEMAALDRHYPVRCRGC